MVVIITGGSSGIGLVTCKYLSSLGYKVYSFSRTTKDIPNINFISCDITNINDIKKSVEEVFEKEKRIDYLINNAGMGVSGAMEYSSSESISKIIDVNLIGLINITNTIIPYLRITKGRIINIGSVAGLLPIPFQTMYSLTKSAVISYSMSLSNELKPFKIKVICVNPGDTKTEFTKNREKSECDSLYENRVKRSVSRMEKDEQNGVNPLKVSKVIYKAMKKKNPKVVVTVGFSYKFIVLLSKILPQKLVLKILYNMYGK